MPTNQPYLVVSELKPETHIYFFFAEPTYLTNVPNM